LKFFNKSETNIYVFDVLFDEEKLSQRPVILKVKGEQLRPGGYGFTLLDSNHEFNSIIIKIIDKYC